MSVFRRKRTGRTGKLRADATWTVEFADHDGVTRRLAAFSDRSASAELERHVKRLVSLRMAGAGPDAELSRFLEMCPAAVRDSLANWGVIACERAAAGKRLSIHLDSWISHLEALESAPRHCRQSKARLERMFSECRMTFWTDVQADKVEAWLAGHRKATMSNRTSNSYLATAKAFCAWMVRQGWQPPIPYLAYPK
ncbi:MAG: site-specific integrase [Planctomycetaceae bacterium]|nr:site-specific integrase [Planctomycetaceae bacterium]